MKLIRSEVLGYCMGVRRAVNVALDCVADKAGLEVFTCGPLIHNPVVLNDLEKRGIKILEEPFHEDLSHAQVVIRAHGIPPKKREELIKKSARLVDATCPRVLSIQKRCENFYKEGYQVFLAGDKNHGEIVGIAGFSPNCIVLENSQDAMNVKEVPDKSALISQTTIKKEEYAQIAQALLEKNPKLVVCDTICPATQERQKALENLAKKVDGIVVVGGKNSANTMRLFLTAKGLCKNAWLVQSPNEIPTEVFSFKTIGITAGASTPDELIFQVEKSLETKSCKTKNMYV